jgi:hypothetical protein
MTFGEYLIGKKIDSGKFNANEPDRWQEWALLFAQVSPASFTSQKLYLINPLRRKYHLRDHQTGTRSRRQQTRLQTENSIALCTINFNPL